MSVPETVDVCFDGLPVDMVMRTLRRLTATDRFQASSGIEHAAAWIAEAAAAAGLDAVSVRHFEADGERRYWTFRAPLSWTPTSAKLSLVGRNGTGEAPLTEYPQMPCSIATYSAGTGGRDRLLPLKLWGAEGDLAGGLVVVPRDVRFSPAVREVLERAGAAGFVADALGSARVPDYPDQTGRIELPPDTSLLGFSVDAQRLALLESAAGGGQTARVSLDVHRDARMPVVTAQLPGAEPRGILFVAHLCHVRPGANDNASGVAALLGIAAAIRGIMRRTGMQTLPRPVGFLWAPEFCGAAAYLHDAMRVGDPLPLCVLNLDMVAENQQLCGGPFLVERSPDHVPTFVDALVERCVELVWERRARSSPGLAGTWQAVPFAGFSDHALFADRSIAVPGMQLGHWPDRFNHSSADDVDKTDPEEVRSVGAAAAAAAWLVATAPPTQAGELADLAARWGVARIGEIAREGGKHRAAAADCFDPFSPPEVASYLDHTEAVAAAAIESTRCVGGTGQRPAARWLRAQARQAALPWSLRRREDTEWERPHGPTERPLQRRWPGPFNLRAALEDLPAAEAASLTALLDGDKRIAGVLLALALAIDDRRSRAEVIRHAAYARQRDIPLALSNRFLDALASAGWIEA